MSRQIPEVEMKLLQLMVLVAVLGVMAPAMSPLECGGMGDDDDDDDDMGEPVVFAPLNEDGVVADVDVERYLGTWREIAVDPQFFSIFCTNTTATYGYYDDDTVTVFNSCNWFNLDGPNITISGFASIVDPEVPAKLRVNFGDEPAEQGAPYWIIELDGREAGEPYEWAVVGGPTLNELFILHRSPQPDDAQIEAIIDRLVERGYDPEEWSFTEQPMEQPEENPAS
ncbi:MAG: lipocalin family protein [Deltaproteobacteria bacterium]|nr:lipocalin family protein [Deltaproteobacteria bacterium]